MVASHGGPVAPEEVSVDEIPVPLRAAVAGHCGSVDRVEDRSWSHGEARVLHVAGERATCFVKLHRTVDHYRREVHAYTQWVTGWTDVPRMLGADDEARAVVVTELPGCSGFDVAARDEPEMHRQAGAFIARLHAVPIDDDDISLDDAMSRRTDAWLSRADGVVDASVVADVRGRMNDIGSILSGWSRRACHRDFTERNWLWDDGRLFVFDFGIARPDLFLADVERLWSSTWRGRPELAEAFWDGYGRRLDADEEAVLIAYGAMQALTTVVWAVDHDDAPFEQHGRDRLDWLLGRA